LSRRCAELLDRAEQRIDELVRAAGGAAVRPFAIDNGDRKEADEVGPASFAQRAAGERRPSGRQGGEAERRPEPERERSASAKARQGWAGWSILRRTQRG